MNILDLAEELNLQPRKAASTKGGEYKGKCPSCEIGKDRFCIWPYLGESGGYWCRVCNCKGDGIQFCRDFLGMTFTEACKKLHIQNNYIGKSSILKIPKKPIFIPQISEPVNLVWQKRAEEFISCSHINLMATPCAISLLIQRGISLQSIQQHSLGWNSKDLFEEKEKWGLSSTIKENGQINRQWLPKGVVIPSYLNNSAVKIKIRRSNWTIDDFLPKYAELSGSNKAPSLYGDIELGRAIVVESELDAILLQTYADDLIFCIALGGCSKRPDAFTHSLLSSATAILISLDMDEAGKKAYCWWKKTYPKSKIWPCPIGKSPGDAFTKGINLHNWIRIALPNQAIQNY